MCTSTNGITRQTPRIAIKESVKDHRSKDALSVRASRHSTLFTFMSRAGDAANNMPSLVLKPKRDYDW